MKRAKKTESSILKQTTWTHGCDQPVLLPDPTCNKHGQCGIRRWASLQFLPVERPLIRRVSRHSLRRVLVLVLVLVLFHVPPSCSARHVKRALGAPATKQGVTSATSVPRHSVNRNHLHSNYKTLNKAVHWKIISKKLNFV